MAEGARAGQVLTAEQVKTVERLAPADVLVGVPALNDAGNIGAVLDAVASGLAKQSAGHRAALLVVDAGSQDGTWDAVRAWQATAPSVPALACLRLAGLPQRGRAILGLLEAARGLGVRACGLVSGGLASFEPGWVERLLRPALDEEADYVSPAYSRPVSEGTLTTNLLAPMTRALYGRRIRQLLGGCAGMSGAFARRSLEACAGDGELVGHGMELWLATEAMASGARVVEAHLGPQQASPEPAQADLATTLVRVVGPLFNLMERYREVWGDIRGSAALPGTGGSPAVLPPAGGPHVDRMVRAFRLGLKDLLPVWEQIMPEETLGRLYPLALRDADEFAFPLPVWCGVVSDFAVACHERRLARDHLLRALAPLYLGRVAAFLREAQAGPAGQLPEIVETIGRAFEAEKERLVARWR
jgi:hypothetical protein